MLDTRMTLRLLRATAAVSLLGGSHVVEARPVTSGDVPQACAVVTQQELQRAGPTPVADVLKSMPGAPGECPKLNPYQRDALAAHNDIRATLGSPPMQWDPVLEQHAIIRAQELRGIGDLIHAPRQGRENERENIARTPNGYSTAQVFGRWTRELADFKPGAFPNVCISGGDCAGVLHLTQMAWPTLFSVGCGSASDAAFTYTVCRYPKGANQDGKEIGTPAAAADGRNAWIRARPVGGDYGHTTTLAGEDGPGYRSRPKGAWYVGGDFGGTVEDEFDFGPDPALPPDLAAVVATMLDFGDDDGVSGFIGGGLGMARVTFYNGRVFASSLLISRLIDFGPDDGLSAQVGGGLGVGKINYNIPDSGLDESDMKLIREVLHLGQPDVETKVEQPTLPAAEVFTLLYPSVPLEPM